LKISNETKVGVLTIIALAILFIGYSFLRGNDVFSSDNKYYTVYDNVDGLTRFQNGIIGKRKNTGGIQNKQ
jgi:phospholipid/cholesterol/gamma-HCH transport system substrate-binding protein